MLHFTADEDVTLTIPFIVDGEYVVPDEDSVVYSVRDTTGALIAGLTSVAVTWVANATEAFITIPAVNNAQTVEHEIRSIIVSFTVGGKPHSFRENYRLHPWINTTVTPESVRALLGLTSIELPDRDINIPAAYYILGRTMGGTTFADALVSGTYKAELANSAIVVQAALSFVISIPMRAIRSEKAGETAYERYPRRNWDNLTTQLTNELEKLLDGISGTVKAIPSGFVVGTRTDPITGA